MATNFKVLSQDEIRKIVDDAMEKARDTDDEEVRKLWSHRARRARAYLPPRRCALAGCNVMVEGGNEFCCMAHAGKESSKRMNKEALARATQRRIDNRTLSVGRVGAVLKPDNAVEGHLDLSKLWDGKGTRADHCPVM